MDITKLFTKKILETTDKATFLACHTYRDVSDCSKTHPIFPFFLIHLFNSITQHGAGHLMDMLAEKIA